MSAERQLQLTTDRLLQLIDLPISLPGTSLEPGDWLVIATIPVADGESLTLSRLQGYVLEMAALDDAEEDPCAGEGAPIIDPSFVAGGLATIFVVSGFVPDTAPFQQAYLESWTAPVDPATATTAEVPVQALRSGDALVLTAGTYSIVMLNNTTNKVLHLTAAGAWRLDTAA